MNNVLYKGTVRSFNGATQVATVVVPQLFDFTPVECDPFQVSPGVVNPADLQPGQNVLVMWDGGQVNARPTWFLMGGSGGGSDEVWIGSEPPSGSQDLWYDTDDPGEVPQMGRIGIIASVASVSFPVTTLTGVTFTDWSGTAGFITTPSTTVTIPVGYSGLYSVMGRSQRHSGQGSWGVTSYVRITVNGTRWDFPTTSNDITIGTMVAPFNAGDTITMHMWNAAGTAGTAACAMYIYRLTV